MAGVIASVKKIINATTTEMIDSDLPEKTADVVNKLVSTVFDVVDDALVSLKDMTKEEPPASPTPPPPPSPSP